MQLSCYQQRFMSQMVMHCICTTITVPHFHFAKFAFRSHLTSQSIAIQDFAADDEVVESRLQNS